MTDLLETFERLEEKIDIVSKQVSSLNNKKETSQNLPAASLKSFHDENDRLVRINQFLIETCLKLNNVEKKVKANIEEKDFTISAQGAGLIFFFAVFLLIGLFYLGILTADTELGCLITFGEYLADNETQYSHCIWHQN